MYISEEQLIKFIVDTLEARNLEFLEQDNQIQFQFYTLHCDPIFRIPKTDSVKIFRKSFHDLVENFDKNNPDFAQDADEIKKVLSKTVRLVDNICLAAEDFNASEAG